ncbi:MAG: hypothetical protein M3P51_02525 [Chloroflexota bacterium]|nr:hypothetical protein [Chloroflexota bacterium]
MKKARIAIRGTLLCFWYNRLLEQRWEQYSSAPWSPIRTATQYTFMVIGGLLVLGSVRAAGPRRLLKIPGFLFRTLQIFVFSYFRPRLEAGDTHGSARWANRQELWKLRAHGSQIVLGRVSPRVFGSLALRWVLAVPVVEHFNHLILVAPPDAGKTTRFIIPSILRECLMPRRHRRSL